MSFTGKKSSNVRGGRACAASVRRARSTHGPRTLAFVILSELPRPRKLANLSPFRLFLLSIAHLEVEEQAGGSPGCPNVRRHHGRGVGSIRRRERSRHCGVSGILVLVLGRSERRRRGRLARAPNPRRGSLRRESGRSGRFRGTHERRRRRQSGRTESGERVCRLLLLLLEISSLK